MILPWPPSVLSPNSHATWRKKAPVAKRYRADCHILTKAARLKVDWDGAIYVFITFFPPDRRYRDDDNIVGAFKAGRDGIADALGVNDRRFSTYPYLSDVVVKGGQVRVVFTEGNNSMGDRVGE